MLSKKTFVQYIEAVKQQHKAENAFSKALQELNQDNYFVGAVTDEYYMAVTAILEDVFCEAAVDLIYWWMYDCNYGQKGEFSVEPLIYNEDGSVLADLTKVEDLYNYIMKM